MKALLTFLAALVVMATLWGQEETPPTTGVKEVSISAKGDDVRGVLADLFAQAKKDFVLEPNIRFVLYLSLSNAEFEEALQIVCKTAELKYEVQNGIYFVTKKKPVVAPSQVAPQPVAEVKIVEAPTGKLPAQVLSKIVTTRLSKTCLREVLREIGRQAGVTIEIDETIPRYKVDAFLLQTSLKYALDVLSKATGTKYVFTDRQSIRLSLPDRRSPPSAHNRVVRAVVQRVASAEVEVDGVVVGRCGRGILVLAAAARDDDERRAAKLADRVAGLRIFNDEAGKMNLALGDLPPSDLPDVLAVSNFTVLGDCAKSRRPSFTDAAPYERGRELFDAFVAALRALGVRVETGVFGADMQVRLVNDGPVTMIVEG